MSAKSHERKASLRDALRQNLETATETVVKDAAATRDVHEAVRSGNVLLPVRDLRPDPDQPRKVFDREALDELKDAILALGGLETPIQVYRRPTDTAWTIKHGERRHRALAELIEEGNAQFERVPVYITTPPAEGLDGERQLRIAQVVENNARRSLEPVETAEQYLWIANAGRDFPLSPREVSAVTGTHLRVVQRHLFVANGLDEAERRFLLEQYPDCPLKTAEALVQWLDEHGKDFDPEQRRAVLSQFASERPSAKMIGVALRELAPKKRVGRPPRRRFSIGTNRSGALQVKLTLPAELTHDKDALERAIADLERAQDHLRGVLAERAAEH